VGCLPSGSRLGCWQLGEPGTDVSGLGDLQRLAELKGLLPGLTCLLVATEPEESITKILHVLAWPQRSPSSRKRLRA
jgi:hypothetical protein